MLESELLKKYGSPLYIYNEKILKDRIRELLDFAKKLEKRINAKVTMHYSTKSNANLNLLKIIKEEKMSVDSMSPIELELTKKAGFENHEILYVCNNISQEEMEYVVNQNILLCLDSVSQIETLGKIKPNTNIMIRINPEEGGVGHCKKVVTAGKEARFGIVEREFSKVFDIAMKYNLKIIGIHQHLGSSFFNEDIDTYLSGIAAGLKLIENYFPNVNILDLGGGFGVPYKGEERLDLNLFSEKLSKILKTTIEKTKINEIKFEPGRYVTCECGEILGTVNSIKESFGITWIGTDIGMNVLLRPSMYDAYHEIEIINKEEEYITATVVGNVCESGDILGKARKVKKAKVNDCVRIKNTGAYGYSMCSNYTGRPKTAEVLINEKGKDILIRKRETIEDVLIGMV